mgnify:CR=1 FL=1
MIINRIQRQKRKFVTSIMGIETIPNVRPKDICKFFGKKFASGAALNNIPGGGTEVVIQGDLQYDLPEVLADTIPPLTGSLFTTGGASATGGADGAETMLIVIDGTTLTFDLAADPQNPGEVDPTLVSAVGGSLIQARMARITP